MVVEQTKEESSEEEPSSPHGDESLSDSESPSPGTPSEEPSAEETDQLNNKPSDDSDKSETPSG